MLKRLFTGREPVVVKLKHEYDVTETLLTEQIRFSEHLAACGVQTAKFYRAGDSYVICRTLHDYEVFITVEEFRSGETGLFDFNRCGDNLLFCDAVMQGVFESRLMDYGRELTGAYSEELFIRFLRGYHRIRPSSDDKITMIPHMYAVITAFWVNWDDILPLDQIAERIGRDLTVDL